MKTVKLRIAVAVDPEGDWFAIGWKATGEEAYDDMMDEAADPVANGERRYWVTAEVEVPEVVEVAGSVEEALTTDTEKAEQ